jgi:hypothetical protein
MFCPAAGHIIARHSVFWLNARAVSPDALMFFKLRRAGLIDGAGLSGRGRAHESW